MSNFHPREVVSRGSETQLQGGENYNNQLSGKNGNVESTSHTVAQH